MNRRRCFAAVLAVAVLLWVAAAGAAATGPESNTGVLLDDATLWRQFQVEGPSRVRSQDGTLSKMYINWRGQVREFPHNETVDLKGAAEDATGAPDLDPPLPPAHWADLDFDDTGWPRCRLPQPEVPYRWVPNSPGWSGQYPYRTVLLLTRGKFEIEDPARVRDCVLSLDYWGGVAVYVNGKEVVRGHLPAGETDLAAAAEEYPVEAFTTAEGKPLRIDDPKVPPDRVALRDRQLRDVKIPAALLRPGVNVLAIEAHQAPVHWKVSDGPHTGARATGWPPIGLLRARLTATPAGAAPASASYPRGIRVWNAAVYDTATSFDYGEADAPLRPIVIRAARNSVFSGRLMVGSDRPIRGLKASVTDLVQAQGSEKLPAAAVRVRYAVPATEDKCYVAPYRFDGLLDVIPAEIPVIQAPSPKEAFYRSEGGTFYHFRVERKSLAAGAVAPLWFTVRVPKDAKAGVYEGKASVAAEGLPPTTVPLRVHVCDWTMPDPRDFFIQNFLYHAEEVHAKYYGVANYSDKHLELVGKSLALMAEVNSRQVNANLACDFFGQGGGGNPESLVRWIKQPDGSFKHDYTNFDRYLDMVAKTIGKPRTLRLNCFIDGRSTDRWPGNQPVSVLDPATGKLDRMNQPAAGTAESFAFWKPVFDEVLKKIKARGWLDETTLGMNIWTGVPAPSVVDVAHRLWPEGEWSWHGHKGAEDHKFVGTDANVAMTVRHSSCVWTRPSGKRPPLWTLDGPRRNTFCSCPRAILYDAVAPPREMRRMVERYAMIRGYDGLADFGMDLFPLPRPAGGYMVPAAGRGSHWSDAGTILALLYPGPEGAVATERFEMFREGLQLCEAVLFIRKAVADKKLGADLEQRADRYVHVWNPHEKGGGYGNRHEAVETGRFVARYLQAEEDAKLLDLAGEVAREIQKSAK